MIDRLVRFALVGDTWVLYTLFLLSVLSIAAMLERALFFLRHRDDVVALRKSLAKALREGGIDEAERALAGQRGFVAGALRVSLGWSAGGPEAVQDALDSELARVRKELERGTNLLGTLGNNAPFVGLLGTVLGVIEAFHHLADTSNKEAMGSVMAGIAEALVATGVGLFVALPAVVAYNVIQARIGAIEGDTQGLGRLVSAYLKWTKEQGTYGAAIGAAMPAESAVEAEPAARPSASTAAMEA